MNEFAIIIPNYNQSHFLPTALNSLKVQSVSLSTAVMDGGSSDQFKDVIKRYRKFVTFYRSHHDEGQSAAINEGSKSIQGKYISWLNADDYLFPYTLKYVKKTFENNPKIDIVYGDAIHVDPDGNFLSYFPPARNFNQTELGYNCFICQPACFMRTEAFTNIGHVNANLHYTMDWDLWCRLSNGGYKFLYVPKPLAAVRYYPETKTLGGDHKRLLELYRIERKYGKRIFKRSWLGSYYYGLSHKKRNLFESAFYFLFKCLYDYKQYIKKGYQSNDNKDLLYGFHRWKSVAEEQCEIHFPWFNTKPWKKLRLQLDSAETKDQWRVSADGVELNISAGNSDYLTYELPNPAENYVCIKIKNLAGRSFQLKSFHVE